MRHSLSRRRFLQTAAAGGVLAASPALGHHRWAIRGTERGALRLVFYTDVHARTEWQTPTGVMMAAGAINAHRGDLVLGGGDLITDGFESSSAQVAPRWDVYMRMHKAIRGELHSAIGNHDLVGVLPRDGSPPAEDPRSEFREHLGVARTYYSFDALGYRVMLLDSVRVSGDKYKYHGWISYAQREWVKQELSRLKPTTPIILVLHIPLLTAFYNAIEGGTFRAEPSRVIVNNLDVLRLFDEHNLVLVLQGHSHVTELLRWRGTTFLTGGAVCGQWWRGPWYGTQEGFNVITLRHDHVDWEYIDYGWRARRPDDQ